MFANVLLVDEVNRAMPRTQSALLEGMAERQVTVDGVTRRLPEPFLVIATENPIEQEGTFPLPEAELDRFALCAGLGYPDRENEVSVVLAQRHSHPIEALRAVVSAREVRTLLRAVEDVYVDDLILRWTVDLVRATRTVAARCRRFRSGQPDARADRARLGAAAWSRLRRAGGHRAALPPGPRTPAPAERLVLRRDERLSRDDALETIRERCLELVPAPDWQR